MGGVNLLSCEPMAPVCTATTKASDLTQLLNSLLFESKTGSPIVVNKAKQLQLATTNDYISLSGSIYDPVLRSLLNKTSLSPTGAYAEVWDSNPKWYATKVPQGSQNLLEGKITYEMVGADPNTINVVITPMEPAKNISDYNSIERFVNVRAYSDPACTTVSTKMCESTLFLADAVVVEAGVKVFKPVSIQVSGIVMSLCRSIVFVKQ
jgi:hypothetical protein